MPIGRSTLTRATRGALVTFALASPALAHPGSGIVVGRGGDIYFLDTGAGVWKVDTQGRLTRHRGSAYHWLAIDPSDRFTQRDMPGNTRGELEVVRSDPTLIVSSDFPVTVAEDGALYFPQPGRDGRVRIVQLSPAGRPHEFATLPVATEIDESGESRPVTWIHGIKAGPGGSIYYAEQSAVRRIGPDGMVTLIAGGITVEACAHPPAIKDDRTGPALRDLAVKPDGTVYVAASGCSAVLQITPGGKISVALRATDAWSPTGVALAGDDIYVLEYRYIDSHRREDWVPRVRKLASNGVVSLVAEVRRSPATAR
jgi:streptogramin lyase